MIKSKISFLLLSKHPFICVTKSTNATSKQNAFMENVTVKETLLGMEDSAEVGISNIVKLFTADGILRFS